MKKFFGLLAVLLTALVMLFCVAGCGVNGYRYDNAKAYTAGGASLSAAGIHAVEIDWISGDVSVVASPTANEIVFSEDYAGQEEDYVMRYVVIRGELKIKFQKSGVRNKDGFPKNLSVTLPASLALTDLEVDAVSGSIVIEGVKTGEIDVDSVSGDVTMRAFSSGSVNIDTVSGDVNLFFSAGAGFRLEFDSVSGTINDTVGAVRNGKYYTFGNGATSTEVDTVSGDLTLSVLSE